MSTRRFVMEFTCKGSDLDVLSAINEIVANTPKSATLVGLTFLSETVPNPHSTESTDENELSDFLELTPIQNDILSVMAHDGSSPSDIGHELKLEPYNVSYHLKVLQKKKFVKNVSRGVWKRVK
jgi:hypothetical protein